MAIRLGDFVVYGELRNTSHYSTHGFIALRGEAQGEDSVLHIELTGNCGADLQGKAFRFLPSEDAIEKPIFRFEDFPGFQDRQVGPTGTMTAQGWVRMLPCPAAEFVRRTELGEMPPTTWKRHLYLEWYSQNGRVLIEMADATVEECVRQPVGDEDEGEWTPIPNLAPLPETGNPRGTTAPSVTILHADGDRADVERRIPTHDTDTSDGDAEYDPFAGDLQRRLDAEAAAIDRAISGSNNDSDDNTLAECEIMDYCIEHCEGEPIASFLGDADHLPEPDTLSDEAVEAQLKVILGQLAIWGVALHLCKHFTPRDCYKLLIATILPESKAYRELAGTGWVQHFDTGEYCAKCEAEFDAEYEAMKGPDTGSDLN
ncbi:MAG: hypothetical protein HZB26_08930 [Candidatus Hydrogenedentes bacterium]|nr:hypothetical protein [Candidatus Hydrogenedentota bacterium]